MQDQARKVGQEIHNYYANNSPPQIWSKGEASAKYRINTTVKRTGQNHVTQAS
jgi:hypothetical protein